jgi:hypothetical protein
MGSRIAAALAVVSVMIVGWGLIVSNAIGMLMARVPVLTR